MLLAEPGGAPQSLRSSNGRSYEAAARPRAAADGADCGYKVRASMSEGSGAQLCRRELV